MRINGVYVWNGSLTALGTTASYSGTSSLAAGDTVDFLVTAAGTWVNDGTDLDATVVLH